MRQPELTTTVRLVLRTLLYEDDLYGMEIARRARMHSSTVCMILRRLKAAGWLESWREIAGRI